MLTLRRATLTTETTRAGEGPSRVVASTSAVDRYGDVIDQASMQLDRYRANPVLLYGHDWSGFVVGNAVDVAVETLAATGRPALVFTPRWDDHPKNPKGELVAHQWGEFLRAVSIGGYAHRMIRRDAPECPEWARGDGGYFLADFEILEISVVPIPANHEALAQPMAAKAAPGFDLVAAIEAKLRDPEFLRPLLTDPSVAAAMRAALLTPAADADPPIFGV